VVKPRPCSHGPETKLNISGTDLRRMLAEREEVSTNFSRPEVIEVLQDYYASLE